ncbi:hypothetical protein ACIBJF_49340 [Streptomyces sp. NPDC050743]|uniref:hypothetical protein n=1 Tax=Streptomyces sp. NPDC050743 TaxID=3365634 RepID=UPI0037B84D0A
MLAAVCRAPGGVRRLPAAAPLLVFRRALGPSGGWWLRDPVEDVVPVRTSCRVTRAEASGSTARLELTGPGGSEGLAVDHVPAATGYRLDIDALAFLTPTLRRRIVCAPGSKAPQLTSTFETSVPGLYVAGSLAAPMFGPMMRFVAGTEYAAARVARDAARWVVAPWVWTGPQKMRGAEQWEDCQRDGKYQ